MLGASILGRLDLHVDTPESNVGLDGNYRVGLREVNAKYNKEEV